MGRDDRFLKQRGDEYKLFYFYQKAEVLYDITNYFAHTYVAHNDRTRDQMIQAARSGKQNIVEGYADGASSSSSEIHLTTIANGSLLELAEDYKDYLRVHGGERWQEGSEKFEKCRKVCATHNDSAFYMERISERSNLTIANIALILLAQVDYLLFKHIEKLKREFLERGGKREEMMRVRKQRRGW